MLKFSTEHEWVQIKNGKAYIGISDYAQNALGDIVYVDLPSVGKQLSTGAMFGSVESVKAVSDLFSPVSGEVAEINEELQDAPELLNGAPYDNWIIAVKDYSESDFDALLDEAVYESYCKNL